MDTFGADRAGCGPEPGPELDWRSALTPAKPLAMPALSPLTAAPAPAPAIAIVAAVAAALTQPAVDGSATALDHCATVGAWPEATPAKLSLPPPQRRRRNAGSGRKAAIFARAGVWTRTLASRPA